MNKSCFSGQLLHVFFSLWSHFSERGKKLLCCDRTRAAICQTRSFGFLFCFQVYVLRLLWPPHTPKKDSLEVSLPCVCCISHNPKFPHILCSFVPYSFVLLSPGHEASVPQDLTLGITGYPWKLLSAWLRKKRMEERGLGQEEAWIESKGKGLIPSGWKN